MAATKTATKRRRGESDADRRAAGQVRYVAWLPEGEAAAAEAKAKAWGLTKGALVREAIGRLPPKPTKKRPETP